MWALFACYPHTTNVYNYNEIRVNRVKAIAYVFARWWYIPMQYLISVRLYTIPRYGKRAPKLPFSVRLLEDLASEVVSVLNNALGEPPI